MAFQPSQDATWGRDFVGQVFLNTCPPLCGVAEGSGVLKCGPNGLAEVWLVGSISVNLAGAFCWFLYLENSRFSLAL